jgi:hypothetical protein
MGGGDPFGSGVLLDVPFSGILTPEIKLMLNSGENEDKLSKIIVSRY